MKKLLFFCFFFSLVSVSCDASKKASEHEHNADLMEKSENYRFSVSFYSIGSGIDVAAKQAYMSFLREFEEKMDVNISYEITQWGREGETDFCFKLAELDEKGQIAFITESKGNLNEGKNVRFKENEPCKRR